MAYFVEKGDTAWLVKDSDGSVCGTLPYDAVVKVWRPHPMDPSEITDSYILAALLQYHEIVANVVCDAAAYPCQLGEEAMDAVFAAHDERIERKKNEADGNNDPGEGEE